MISSKSKKGLAYASTHSFIQKFAKINQELILRVVHSFRRVGVDRTKNRISTTNSSTISMKKTPTISTN